MSDRLIRVVLDTSAVLAYTQGSIDVGEVVAEVDDESGAVALPILSLIEAYRVVADRDRLWVLVNHPTTVVLTVDPQDWQTIAELAEASGRIDAAEAALIAVDCDATMLTRQPALYVGIDIDFPIIGF